MSSAIPDPVRAGDNNLPESGVRAVTDREKAWAAQPGQFLGPELLRSTVVSAPESSGLSLTAFRGLRFVAEPDRLGSLLCPPYDVIDAATRQQLIGADPDNVVRIVCPNWTAQTLRTAIPTHPRPRGC